MRGLIAVVVLIGSSVLINADQQDPLERARLERRSTLNGLRGVRVVVEDVNIKHPGTTLTTSMLQTDLELRLRQSGIAVLDQTEFVEAPGNPVLTLQIALLPLSTVPGRFAFDIHLDLEQLVQLARKPATKVWAVTWSTTGQIGLVGSNQLDSLRGGARDLVDQFVNDYLAENPRR